MVRVLGLRCRMPRTVTVGRTLPTRRASMKFWAAAALTGWIALWMMVYRGKRRERKASESVVEGDVEGLAPSTTTQGFHSTTDPEDEQEIDSRAQPPVP